MKALKIFICICIFFANGACNENTTPVPDPVKSIEIGDAFFLGIDNNEVVASSNNNLVKLTSDDLSQAGESVHFKDILGQYIDENSLKIEVKRIMHLSAEYMLLFGDFSFESAAGKQSTSTMIANTKTGTIFDLKGRYIPDASNWYLGMKYHQTDAEGNIYYRYKGISRLVPEMGGGIRYELYSDYTAGFSNDENFFVDQAGNVYFNRGRQIKKAGGGIIESAVSYSLFNGFNGVIGISDDLDVSRYGDHSATKAYYLRIDGDSVKTELFSTEWFYFMPFNLMNAVLYSNEEEVSNFLITGLFSLDLADGPLYSLGLAFFESERSVYNIITENEILFCHVLGLEDHYLWLENEGDYIAYDLNEYSINDEENTITLKESIVFDIPDGYQLQQVSYNRDGLLDFIGYDLSRELHGKGYISMKNGLEFIPDDSNLGSVELTRLN